MILYEVIKRQINALHMMKSVAGLPALIAMNHTILWLGEITSDLFTVQIRKDKKELGWLYDDISIILYEIDGQIYECSVPKLRELAESELKEKRITNNAEENAMTKDITGEVLGYINTLSVVEISNLIA